MHSLGRTLLAAGAALLPLLLLPACDRNPLARPKPRTEILRRPPLTRANDVAGAYYEMTIKTTRELLEAEAHFLGAPVPAGTARIAEVADNLEIKDPRYKEIEVHRAWDCLARVYAGDAAAEAELEQAAVRASIGVDPLPVAPAIAAQLPAARLFDTLQMQPAAGVAFGAAERKAIARFDAVLEDQLEQERWTKLSFIARRQWARALQRWFRGDAAGAAAELDRAGSKDLYATCDQAAYLRALLHHAAGDFAEAIASYDAMLAAMAAKETGRKQADRRWPIAFYNRAMAKLALPEPDRAGAVADLREAAARWAKSARPHHRAFADAAEVKAQELESK